MPEVDGLIPLSLYGFKDVGDKRDIFLDCFNL